MSRLGRLFDKFRPAAQTTSPIGSDLTVEGRWVIAGLGNPGEQYRRSRHNMGFRAINVIAKRAGVKLNRRKFNGLYAEARIADTAALLVAPQTFYNRSGDCLSALLGYYKVPVDRLIVIHDEMDLPLRQIRIKRGGGDAGNRGVRSVAAALGDREFIRIRIGVGHPGNSAAAIEHVLEPLDDDELRVLTPLLDRVADAIEALIRDGLERAMNLYNQRAD